MSRVALRAWCLVNLIAAMAGAQTYDKAAEALFRAGRLAMKNGETELACKRFRESLELRKTAGTQLNLAICEQTLGNLPRAWALLQALTHSLPATDRRRELVERRLEGVEARVARVTLVAEAQAPPDITVRDPVSQAELPVGTTFALMPGPHEIEVRASSHEPRTYPLTLVAAEAVELAVRPGPRLEPKVPLPKAASTGDARTPLREDKAALDPERSAETSRAAPERRATEPIWSRRRWAGVVAMGVAGIALTTSGVAGLLVLKEKEVVADECTTGPTGKRECTDKGLQAGERGQLYSGIGTVSFAVALLGAGLGGYLWLSEDHHVTAGATASEARVSLSGSF